MTEQKQDSWSGGVYRPELSAKRAESIYGDVVIAVPLSWRIIGALMTAAVAVAAIFLALASYSRIEIAMGTIVPDTGIATVVPSRSGVITQVHVRYGEKVNAGDLLVSISVEEQLTDAMSTADRVVAAIALQDTSVLAQIEAARQAMQAQLDQIAAERAGAIAEVEQIKAQILLQDRLVESAKKSVERVRVLGERGFLSERDLMMREDELIGKQQQLLESKQRLAAQITVREVLERSAEVVSAQANAQAANLAAVRAQVEQQAANVEGSRSYVLKAPFSGNVTALTARTGRYASAGQPLLSVVPDSAMLHAELSVPTTAIAFVRPGQEVSLAIDAFPYQRFGTLKGTVTMVSESAISVQPQSGATRSMYPVFVSFEKQSMYAFGHEQPLIPDMTVTARIVTERQSLIEWIFQPLYAVRER